MCWNRRRRCGCCRCCACGNNGNANADQPQARSGLCTVTGTLRYTDVPMTTVDGLSDDSGCGCSCGTAVPWNGRCR